MEFFTMNLLEIDWLIVCAMEKVEKILEKDKTTIKNIECGFSLRNIKICSFSLYVCRKKDDKLEVRRCKINFKVHRNEALQL